MLILFKIWCTCLVLTIPFIMVYNMPRRKYTWLDAFIVIGITAMVAVDLILMMAALIGAIWV